MSERPDSYESYGVGDMFRVETDEVIDGVNYRGRVGVIHSVDWSQRWTVVELYFGDLDTHAKPIAFLRLTLTRVNPDAVQLTIPQRKEEENNDTMTDINEETTTPDAPETAEETNEKPTEESVPAAETETTE